MAVREKEQILAWVRSQDREAAKSLSKARLRTLRAIREANRLLAGKTRGTSVHVGRYSQFYASPPPKGKFGIRPAKPGSSQGGGGSTSAVRTVHFRLGQSPSGEASHRHQYYIEREDACVASFGNIHTNKTERARVWREIHQRTLRKRGSIQLTEDTPIELKKAILEEIVPVLDSLPFSEQEIGRLRMLQLSDDEAIQKADFTLRTQDLQNHKHWLKFLSQVWDQTKQRELTEEERAAKKYSRWTPPGIRDRKPRDGIVQRRIILELPHELSIPSMEKALQRFCEKHFAQVSWHATIHQPENKNDIRNWHAHVVYTQFPTTRVFNETGKFAGNDAGRYEFEDDPKRLPENAEMIKVLTGNPPKEWGWDRKKARQGTKDLIKEMRTDWCELLNTELSIAGSRDLYTASSYKDLGIEATPGTHRGSSASAILERQEQSFWEGYADTWAHTENKSQEQAKNAAKADAEDRARIFASILENTRISPDILDSLKEAFDKEGVSEQDRRWDQILERVYPKDIPESHVEADIAPIETQEEQPAPDPQMEIKIIWEGLWTRHRREQNDLLRTGSFAYSLVSRDPDLEEYRRVLGNPKSSKQALIRVQQNLPSQFRESAKQIANTANAWSHATMHWKNRANRIFELRLVQPMQENDEMSGILLQKIRNLGVYDHQLQFLVGNADVARHLIVSGERGLQNQERHLEIEDALEKASHFRKAEHLRDFLDPVFRKYDKHIEETFPDRGNRWKAKYSLLEDISRFRELWDQGKEGKIQIQEIQRSGSQWINLVLRNLSQEEKQDFEASLQEEIQENIRTATDQAWNFWKSREIPAQTDPDLRYASILEWQREHPGYDSGAMAAQDPRAASMIRKHLQQAKIWQTQIQQTQTFLEGKANPLQKQNAALSLIQEFGHTVETYYPALHEKLRNHTQTFRKDLQELDWPPNPQELLRISRDNREQSTRDPGQNTRDADWKEQVWQNWHQFGVYIQAANHLLPEQVPVLEAWETLKRTADREVLEKFGKWIQQTKITEEQTLGTSRLRFTPAEVTRLAQIEPRHANLLKRISEKQVVSALEGLQQDGLRL